MSRKYNYLTIIQGNYGYGWEDESEYDGSMRDRDAYRDIKEYRLACPQGCYRIIRRREINK